jgi:nucleoside 2-deoxyribosyltransferase
MKVVVCGSYGDIDGFLKVLRNFQQEYGKQRVFPNGEHLRQSEPCIKAHHASGHDTEETIAMRSKLMQIYFSQIDRADLVVIRNEKNGKEHYGTGTTIELGYAIAKGKKILLTRKPTDSNILSLTKGNPQFMKE